MNDVIDSLFEIKAEYFGENEFVVNFFFQCTNGVGFHKFTSMLGKFRR